MKIIFLSIVFSFLCYAADKSTRFKKMREEMVQQQIERRGVKDPQVLAAMRAVEREKFVPSDMQDIAYEDNPLPIGQQQTISQPYIVAYMTEALKLKSSDRVLEIGTGSGYQAAVLAKIAKQVYSIEIIPELGKRASELLAKEGYKNIEVKIGDGYLGWQEKAPFDAIILTAAPKKIPQPLIDQLKEGGRLIAPEGGHLQELILITKEQGKIKRQSLLGVRFVPMTGKSIKD